MQRRDDDNFAESVLNTHIEGSTLPRKRRKGVKVDLTSTFLVVYNATICLSKLGVFYFQARAGEASTVDFLKVAQAFVNETNYTVWSDLLSGLALLSTLVQYTDYHADFKRYNCQLLSGIAEKLGWDPVSGESKCDFHSVVCLVLYVPG